MKRTLALTIGLCSLVFDIAAQTLTGTAPQKVAMGAQFRVQYSVNTHDATDFQLGQLPYGIELLMGPKTSTSTSITYQNGQNSRTETTTFSFVLKATSKGQFTIPAASVKVKGNTFTSNTLRITVNDTAPDEPNTPAGSTGNGNPDQQTGKAAHFVSGDELFIKATANKRRVMEQEPILLTYKVYTQQNLSQLSGKMPELSDFVAEELPLPQQKKFETEQLDGKNYRTVTWSQYVLFPQTAGRHTIPSCTYEGIVTKRKPNVDPFDAFFNGGTTLEEAKRQIVAPSVEVEVEPLPQKPEDFSGGVGTFAFTARMDRSEGVVGDTALMTATVSGVGNLKFIDQPLIHLPKGMTLLDVERDNHFRLTTKGVKGEVTFRYTIVLNRSGRHTISPASLTYFDTETRDYKTLLTDRFTLTVSNADGSIDETPADDDEAPAEAGPSAPFDWRWAVLAALVAALLYSVYRLALALKGRKK